MKNVKYTVIGFAALTLAYCKTAKQASTNPPASYVPSEKQIELAQKRWTNTTAEEIKQGQNIFVTKCTECHGPYEIAGFSEKKWLHEIDDMSPKANLTADEKLKLTKHILSYREMALAEKAK